MAGPNRKLLAATALIGGVAWVVPTFDDGVRLEGDTNTVSPAFEVQIRRSTLHVSGHAASARHEDQLRRVAAEAYPTLELRFEFRPLGVVPDWWSTVSADLVAVLATMVSPSARLNEDSLHVRAVVADDKLAEAWLAALSVPDSVKVSTQFTRVASALAASALCQRQFDRFVTTPIRFEESGTTLRDSAYPALDRVAALADACRDALVRITGHTDSSGDSEWNRRLSFRRAEVVAAYLEDRGIDADRLIAEGAGSAVPIADNATRYGRSMNRRIEITFTTSDRVR